MPLAGRAMTSSAATASTMCCAAMAAMTASMAIMAMTRSMAMPAMIILPEARATTRSMAAMATTYWMARADPTSFTAAPVTISSMAVSSRTPSMAKRGTTGSSSARSAGSRNLATISMAAPVSIRSISDRSTYMERLSILPAAPGNIIRSMVAPGRSLGWKMFTVRNWLIRLPGMLPAI